MKPFESFKMSVPTISPDEEIRLRCLEAAIKHNNGRGGDVLSLAQLYVDFVIRDNEDEKTEEDA